MKVLKKLLLVAMLISLPVVQVSASAKTWVNVAKVFRVDTVVPFRTAEGMCVDPNDNAIYTIQKDADENCALFKNGKLVKKAFNGKNTSSIVGHGNDMSYYNNHLYIADYNQPKVHRMKKSGSSYVYEKTYTLPNYDKVWNFATYKRAVINGSEKQLFVLGVGSSNSNKTFEFVIAWFDNTSNKFHKVGSIIINNPNSNTTSKDQPNTLQGMTYNQDTGWLHVGFSAKSHDDIKCTKNNIISVKATHVSGSKTYKKADQVIRTYNSPDGKKYEIESIAIDSNGRFYSLVNEGEKKDGTYKDSVYHIKTQ